MNFKKNNKSGLVASDKPGIKKQFLLSLSLVCLVSAVCFLFSAYIGSEVVAFILLLTLSLIAMFFDILPVLLSALLSALIWDFFFIVPRFNFRVGNTEDKIMLSMYFVIALVNAVLTYKIRQFEKLARIKEEKAQTIRLYNTLLNSLSHEFRTPIATIIGATDNLIADSPKLSGTDRKELLNEISIATLRLNRQVENLLNVSRLESGFIEIKKDWCDVNELIYDVIQTLAEQLKSHIVKIYIPDTLPLFRLDYGLMEQALYNLIHNACQYTPDKSNINIYAEHIGEGLLIVIEDGGPGFPKKEIGNIFEKFYRLQNSSMGGTGLGLSIVKGFIEAHKGVVEVNKSALGGAKFSITLPTEKMFLKTSEK